DLAIVLLISLPFFVFFRFGGMPRAKGLFRAKVSQYINLRDFISLKFFKVFIKKLLLQLF
ncbi:hypothetical protein, partial [Acinetobacter baumannii]|uniref:hypothetical protein n=1 Tax=Acinetobacter baumannii TaxID=470 RepID=UPI003AFAD347